MAKRGINRALLIIYGLLVYVVAQFLWWAFLIYQQGEKLTSFQNIQSHNYWMIIGEGSVFLCIIFIGFFQVIRAIKKEKQLAYRRNNFLLSVTHELKTPITANQLALQALVSKKLDPEKQKEIIERSIGQNHRLSGLVDNILFAYRLSSNAFTPYFEKINPYKTISDIASNLRFIYPETTIVMDHEFEAENIRTDHLAFTTILYNILENAAKYGSGTRNIIKIQCKKVKNEFLLEISDEGKGIPDGEKKKVFNQFYRVQDENTRTQKGTGLGLFIVKQLVLLLKGRIELEDNQPNGTVFKIHLPIRST